MGASDTDILTYKRLLRYAVPYLGKLICAMLLMIVVSSTMGLLAYLVQPAMDKIFIARDLSKLALIPLALIGIFLMRAVCDYGRYYLMADVGQSIVKDIRLEIYSHIQKLSMRFFIHTPTGQLISRITNDVNMVQASVTSAVTGLVRESFTMLGLVFVVFYRDWRLALIAMVVFPVIIYPVTQFSRKLKRYSTKSMQVMAGVTTLMDEAISGIRIVKAYNMEDYEIERFDVENRRYYRNWMRRLMIRAISTPLLELISGLAMAFILFYGGHKVIDGQMTTGEFFSFMTALSLLFSPIRRLNEINIEIAEGVAAAKRVFNLIDTPADITDKPDAVSIGRVTGRIEYDQVRFSYYGDREALKGVSFTVEPGQKVALVGESGSGKTTIANLLPRLFDVTGGRILVDGVDLRDVTMHSLRANLAMVTQEMILFNDTVAANIAYGAESCDMALIEQAARAANAHDFILDMEDGYATMIGEGGVRLSGGQRQRLCIARAIMKNAPILILDEATSALDTQSEREVQGALESLMQGRTTLVIAHRLSTVVKADRIIVMDQGEIVEQGTHDELMDLGGRYAMLYRLQVGEA
ncbi:MAG: Lipid A export ATP-binding/permease protein MsbA [Deltaproteobacteria bacterium ADurb.Bin510]|nr:MAG: Lipid A export ATP-binding/permease protein MsbA [Deltaproteobacteria bacterium ADurb.Bin510]